MTGEKIDLPDTVNCAPHVQVTWLAWSTLSAICLKVPPVTVANE